MLWENHFCLKLWLWNVFREASNCRHISDPGDASMGCSCTKDFWPELRLENLHILTPGCAWWTSSQSLATLTGDGQGSRMPCWKSGTSLNLKLDMLQRSWSMSRESGAGSTWCRATDPQFKWRCYALRFNVLCLPGSQIWCPTRKNESFMALVVTIRALSCPWYPWSWSSVMNV